LQKEKGYSFFETQCSYLFCSLNVTPWLSQRSRYQSHCVTVLLVINNDKPNFLHEYSVSGSALHFMILHKAGKIEDGAKNDTIYAILPCNFNIQPLRSLDLLTFDRLNFKD